MFLGLLLALSSLPALADFAPFVVKDMRVEGLQRISEGTVFNYLPINIGDTVDDMRAAKAAGMFAIGVLPPGSGWGDGWPEWLYDAGADRVFAHIDEVLRWLLR